ncbi:hypothetical protein THAOC_29443 [Thalassiosira oceanica]|uniref:Uncharacterized protein n=1 Tax=Thalassiosira oceanica TaxID=159749 RepID=K0RR61_THAOC|nr:hypothetical protein THAOC_29443 [Thalassiosira oceanica]|eukprot:EJK51386.1 hypothetical protein THAOC_29443 [Thalassiosira oceanica]
MCLVANDGCVYSYNPLRVLLNFKSEFQSGKELGDSFASILFGRGLHRKINEQIVPLSRPRRILQLSQIDRNCCVEEGGETFPGSHETGPVKREREKHWDYLSSFDASIDPSSLRLRTERRTNTIIGSCITSNVSNAFLAVCGKGLRRRSKDLLESGGYVTFISLKNGAEVRTLFLPLEPTSIHTAYWTGMHFVMIMGRHDRSGKPYALAIRVDHGVPSADFSRDIQDAMQRTRRFQAFPIDLHDCMEPSRIIGMSSVPSSPPGILVSCGYQQVGKGQRSKLVVTNNTLALRTTKGGVFEISSSVCSGHTAFLDDEGKAGISDIWCIGGQGWSLIGLRGKPSCYFVCWEGARDEVEGPHVIGLQQEGPWDRLPAVASASFDQVALSDSFGVSQPIAKSFFSQTLNGLPNFSAGYSPSKTFSLSFEDSVRMTVAIDGQLDIVLSNALDSITPDHNASPDTRATINNSRRKKLLSLKDKSNRLLKQCDSWIQLEDTKANRVLVDGQVIVANIRFGPRLQSLTMRTNTIANPITTPFNQILSWLCQRRDYSTAASVALSLLGDAESVYQLCGIPIDPDENFTRHEGLLDGITPIDGIPDEAFSATLASLADMAVGCLIKGGVSMSQSLEGFLSRNTQYNASRACLMLVGSVAIALSRYSPPPQQTSNVNIVRLCEESERLPTEVTWPVSSLMKMSVVRNCLPETLLLLNATISNELRWRAPRSRGLATEARPSLGLFLSLVEIILESADESTRLLLDMVDDETGKVYWWSIEDDAKLALCMVSIRGRHVMLLEPEVRAWLLVHMKREIDSTAEARHIEADPELSSELLKEVISGVFGNAGCDLVIKLETYLNETSESPTCYRQSMDVLKGLLGPSNGMLDFDTLIAGLLLLIRRGRSWGHSTGVSTQTLLNAVCDLAGRRSSGEPIFVFDSATVMRQCALCNNVQAAAFLVGGKNGLVLECSDLLLASLQSMDMKTAENALLSGSLTDLQTIAGQAMGQQSQFSLSSCHEHILWLLETYVLSASTYGEFETSPSALGKDPVFTGRVCFRAWYCLTSSTPDSTRWLESWLRDGLRLHGGVSPKRLACAALIRSLIWADELDLDGDGESDLLLATLIGFGNSFLAELAQTCCGLIESVPSNLAEEICSSSTEPLFVLNQVETLAD